MARLTGAALKSRVVANLRGKLARDYGFPMDEYATANVWAYNLGRDMQPVLTVQFCRRSNGATLQVDSIYPADNGDISQRDSCVELMGLYPCA